MSAFNDNQPDDAIARAVRQLESPAPPSDLTDRIMARIASEGPIPQTIPTTITTRPSGKAIQLPVWKKYPMRVAAAIAIVALTIPAMMTMMQPAKDTTQLAQLQGPKPVATNPMEDPTLASSEPSPSDKPSLLNEIPIETNENSGNSASTRQGSLLGDAEGPSTGRQPQPASNPFQSWDEDLRQIRQQEQQQQQADGQLLAQMVPLESPSSGGGMTDQSGGYEASADPLATLVGF